LQAGWAIVIVVELAPVTSAEATNNLRNRVRVAQAKGENEAASK